MLLKIAVSNAVMHPTKDLFDDSKTCAFIFKNEYINKPMETCILCVHMPVNFLCARPNKESVIHAISKNCLNNNNYIE